MRGIGPGSLQRRLLIEIDETLMPRRLRIETDTGRTVVLLAANGRLHAVEASSMRSKVEGKPLDGSDGALPTVLKSVLDGVLDGASAMFVQREDASDIISGGAAGPSARILAQAWGVSLRSTPNREAGGVLDDFLASIQKEVTAWFLPGESGGEGAGDPDRLDELRAVSENPPKAPAGTWSFTSVRRAPHAPDHVVIARYETDLVLLAIPRAQLTRVADAWRLATQS